MSSTAYYYPRKIEIDTATLGDDPDLYAEIISYHGKSTRENPIFRCLEPEGGKLPMLLVRNPHQDGSYFLRHFAGDNTEGHTHDSFSAPMSIEHRRQTEYIERAAQFAGLETKRELSTGKGTRVDLAVYGARDTGFEIQWSDLSVDGDKGARGRATKSHNGGWQTVWVTTTNPSWLGTVPGVRISGADWGTELPCAGSVSAIISEFSTEMSWPTATLKNQYRVLPLDDLVPLIVSGDIIPVAGPDGVALADANTLDMLTEFEGCGIWTPDYTPKARSAKRTRRCHSHEQPAPPPLPPPKPVVLQPIPRPAPVVVDPVIEREPCQKCGGTDQRHVAETLKYSGAQGIWMCRACYDQMELAAAQAKRESAERDFVQSWLDAESAWWRDVGEITCPACGLPINPAFHTLVHYDCARRTRNAA